MAGKPVGTMYVELSLDATKYTASQKAILAGAKQNSADINKVFKTVGTQSDEMYNAMRLNIQNAYNAIANSAKSSADEIRRAHESSAEKIKAIDKQQFGERTSMLETFKNNWLAVTGALAAVGISTAFLVDSAKMALAAKQSEESFRLVSKSANESADEIISAMEKASAGTIDASELMQKATQGMLLGLSGSDMIKISEMARQSARTLGIDVSEAFNRITDSISTNMPRALKQMGLITKEQMDLMNKAIGSGVENVNLLSVAYGNYQNQQKKTGVLVTNEAELVQQLGVQWKEFKELIGGPVVAVLVAILSPIVAITKAIKEQKTTIEDTVASMNELNKAAEAYAPSVEEAGVSSFRGKIVGAPKYTEPSEAERYKTSIKDPYMVWLSQEMDKRNQMKITAETGKMLAEAMATDTYDQQLAKIEAIRKADLESFRVSEELKKKEDRANAEEIALRQEAINLKAQTARVKLEKEIDDEIVAARMQAMESLQKETPMEKFMAENIVGNQQTGPAFEKMRRKRLDTQVGDVKSALDRMQAEETSYLAGHNEMEDLKVQKDLDAMDEIERRNKTMAENMQRDLSSLGLDIMQGKLTSFKDFASAIFQSIQKAAANYLGAIATDFLYGGQEKGGKRSGGFFSQISDALSSFTGGGGGGGGIGGLLGGLFGGGGGAVASGGGEILGGMEGLFAFHKGGIVGETQVPKVIMPRSILTGAPRYHSGLASDEVPSILKKGETVLPVGSNNGGGQLFNININAVDAKSFSELASKNPNAIIGPFLTALQKGGQLRNALAEAR